MADRDVVLFAGVDHLGHPLEHGRVLVLARQAELLRQITLADQDGADAFHLAQDGVEALDPLGVLHHQDHEDFAFGIERPHVGALVVFLLRDAPIAHCRARAVAADALRLVQRFVLQARIAAGGDRVVGLLHRGDVRPDDAIAAEVECLLGLELRLLGAVRGDAHDRSDRRRHRAGARDLPAVEHVLQAVAQRPDVPRIVLHLVDDAVVFGGRHRDRGLGFRLAEAGERRLARLQRFDHSIKTR